MGVKGREAAVDGSQGARGGALNRGDRGDVDVRA
jgi:hypothetical protein